MKYVGSWGMSRGKAEMNTTGQKTMKMWEIKQEKEVKADEIYLHQWTDYRKWGKMDL